jgi:hypothetical protein
VAIEKRDVTAGRPLRGVGSLATPSRPAAPGPRAPARRPPPVAGPPTLRLVLWPALLTLGVTALRLVGELRGWSPETFSRLPGGGLSPLGISWLPPLVGAWFGWRLARSGVVAPGPGRAFGVPTAALVAGLLLGTLLERRMSLSVESTFVLWAVVALLVAVAAFAAWPRLGRPLLVYAFAARVPVALVMAVAMWRAWGTHYDARTPGFPLTPPLPLWLWTGLLPQATVWVAWTLALGALGGAAGALLARWPRRPR